MWTWGGGDHGQLGHGDVAERLIPTKVAGVEGMESEGRARGGRGEGEGRARGGRGRARGGRGVGEKDAEDMVIITTMMIVVVGNKSLMDSYRCNRDRWVFGSLRMRNCIRKCIQLGNPR